MTQPNPATARLPLGVKHVTVTCENIAALLADGKDSGVQADGYGLNYLCSFEAPVDWERYPGAGLLDLTRPVLARIIDGVLCDSRGNPGVGLVAPREGWTWHFRIYRHNGKSLFKRPIEVLLDGSASTVNLVDVMQASAIGGTPIITGPKGDLGVFGPWTATSLAAGAAPTLVQSGSGTSDDPFLFNLGIPRGDTGAPGGSDAATAEWVTSGTLTAAAVGDATGVIQAEAHGATGDGTTDDASALQVAVNAAAASQTRKIVRLTRGRTYRLGTHVSVGAGVRIDGNGATLKPLAGSLRRALQILGSGVLVNDLTIDMNRSETANGGSASDQQGILVNAASAPISDVTIRRVTIVNSHQRGIVAQASPSQTLNRIYVEDCVVADVGDRGIHIGGSGAATNRDIRVTGCRILRPGQYAIICQGVAFAAVDRCEAVGTPTGAGSGIVMSATGAISTDWQVTRCVVNGFVAAGQWGIVATVGAKRFGISDNRISGCTGGITVDPEDPASLGTEVPVAATITGNTVTATTGAHGINIRLCNGASITGNTIEDTYDRGIAVSSATGVTISGNSIARSGNDGIGIFGTASGGGHTVGVNTIRSWGARVSALRIRAEATPTPNAFTSTQATP